MRGSCPRPAPCASTTFPQSTACEWTPASRREARSRPTTIRCSPRSSRTAPTARTHGESSSPRSVAPCSRGSTATRFPARRARDRRLPLGRDLDAVSRDAIRGATADRGVNGDGNFTRSHRRGAGLDSTDRDGTTRVGPRAMGPPRLVACHAARGPGWLDGGRAACRERRGENGSCGRRGRALRGRGRDRSLGRSMVAGARRFVSRDRRHASSPAHRRRRGRRYGSAGGVRHRRFEVVSREAQVAAREAGASDGSAQPRRAISRPGDERRGRAREIASNQASLLVVMEAMKMVHSLRAAGAGAVREIHCSPGRTVTAGELLVEFELANGRIDRA